MEHLKQKYPYVEEEMLSIVIDFNDKKVHKELQILNDEREKRIKAEKIRNEMNSKCLLLEQQLRTAMEELEKRSKDN